MTPAWIIMPVVAGPEMTEAALSDCLAQTVPVKVLVINQGVDSDFRDHLERLSEADERILVWHHEPPLLSLAATWNRALDFVWEAGGREALVINNDVRIDPRTYSILEAVLSWPRRDNLFVTAVGVTEDQYHARPDPLFNLDPDTAITDLQKQYDALAKGGPDFSCFMISAKCHQSVRFDENFVPAFCEDLDYHRRLLLAGEGTRIFSINLPYLHYSSQTLKQVDPQRRMRIERQIEQGSRAYYQKKWGGPVNAERFWVPFGGGWAESENKSPESFSGCGPTTPELQAHVERERLRA